MDPGKLTWAVPEEGKIHLPYSLFEITDCVSATKSPTGPAPHPATYPATRPATHPATHPTTHPTTHPATHVLRSLHTYVRFTHTFASLTHAAGREISP